MYAFIIFCIIILSCASTVEPQTLSFSESYTAQIVQTVQYENITYAKSSLTVYRDYSNNRQLTVKSSTSSLQIAVLISGGFLWVYGLDETCFFQLTTNTLPEIFFYLNYLTLISTVDSIETWRGIVTSNFATVTVIVTVNSNDRTMPLTFTSVDIVGTVTHQDFVSWTAGAPVSSVFVPPTNCPVLDLQE